MKALLMNPLSSSRELEFCDMGLGYLASGLRQAGHEVELLLRSMKEDDFRRFLAHKKPEVLGLKVFTSNMHEAAHTVELIRSSTKSTIVLGGPHVSGDPLGVLNYIPADYGFQGEADYSFTEFVSLLAAGAPKQKLESLPGLIYRKNGAITVNPQELISDLDQLPFPAWDLMPPGEYQSLVRRRSPAASVVTARGCTNLCSFCAESYKKLRHRSVENVVAEIKYLVERYNVREIQFLDSNFIASKDYIKALCHLILENGLSLAFCAPNGSRLECVDEEVCALLVRAGFYRVNVGIESGSPEVLKMVCKGSNLERITQKIKLLRMHGIQVIGNFMFGFPGETRQQMNESLKLALALDLTAANFSIYAPMPGTRMHADLVRAGKLDRVNDFRNYDFVSYENNFSELSPKELKRFRNKCFFRFIVRLRTLKTLYELLRYGMLWNNLVQRLYWMYISKFIKDKR